jgi:sugar lactone lactonase YvrE
MSVKLFLGLFALAAAGPGPASGEDTPIIPSSAQVKKIAGECKFTEGPAVDAAGNVFFSDSPNNRIMVYTAGGKAQVWKGAARGANGMLFDREGRLVTCNSQLAPDGRSVTRYEKDGRLTVLADRYHGKKLNSPNDLAIDREGRIYFTDPRYGEQGDLEQETMAVYRIERDGKVVRVIHDLQVPNGILITPDNRTLYVADNSPAEGGARTLVAYDVSSKGKVTRRKVVYDFGKERGVDGMVMDAQGNIYATAGLGEKTGVYVISPEGRLLTFIRTPETATNCTFGGKDLRTLYITAGESLYRIRASAPGHLVYPTAEQAEKAPQENTLLAFSETVLEKTRPQIVVDASAAGGYAAFPDVCRTPRGDLVCVFYSGYAHVSHPKPGWPLGGRVMMTRSSDEGRTWSKAAVILDTPHDDRDPHVSCLADGTLVVSWFVTWNPASPPPGQKHPHALFHSSSVSDGGVWSPPQQIQLDSPDWWACSAPIRELKDGTWILGIYTEAASGHAWGATIRSRDRGKTWGDLAAIGRDAKLPLDAETDVIELKDGRLLAALRSSRVNLHFAWSSDGGRSWTDPRDSGFRGHCPIFLRMKSGTILLGHRVPNTALHWSADDGASWNGPVQIDAVIGAYPGLVELPGGDVFCVYYEEGSRSSIRGQRLRVTRRGIVPVERL